MKKRKGRTRRKSADGCRGRRRGGVEKDEMKECRREKNSGEDDRERSTERSKRGGMTQGGEKGKAERKREAGKGKEKERGGDRTQKWRRKGERYRMEEKIDEEVGGETIWKRGTGGKQEGEVSEELGGGG